MDKENLVVTTPLWKRILFGTLTFVGRHVFMLMALVWFAFGDWLPGLFCIVAAFYFKLCEMAERMNEMNVLNLTINNPRRKVAFGEEHF